MIVGVDPGLGGGIACSAWVQKMPTLASGKSKSGKVLDEPAIRKLLVGAEHVFIESVHSMPKQGVVSGFTFGTVFGILRGICVGLEIPYTLVEPRVWQKEMLKGVNRKNTKKASVIIAKRLFPKMAEDIGTHDGKSDALLICEFGRRQLRGK